MKRFLAITFLVLTSLCIAQAHPGRISFGLFYSSLEPYGEWIEIEPGVFAWQPERVSHSWRPYTVGRWAWTDEGWYWCSDEPYGWAVYHYGRWYHDEYYGWIWIPGYEWAPAWVEWRYGSGFIGWAPLSPYAVFSIHVGIHYSTRWVTPYHYWSFVDCGYIVHSRVHLYVYNSRENYRYVSRTRSGGDVVYRGGRIRTGGPNNVYVERTARVRIERSRIVDAPDIWRQKVARESGVEEIAIYRPRFDTAPSSERPRNVKRTDRGVDIDVKHIDTWKESRSDARNSGNRNRMDHSPKGKDSDGPSQGPEEQPIQNPGRGERIDREGGGTTSEAEQQVHRKGRQRVDLDQQTGWGKESRGNEGSPRSSTQVDVQQQRKSEGRRNEKERTTASPDVRHENHRPDDRNR